jgi:nitroimidazol reductase NimA-like FMN-containing flavoprotein (pyridoxamine 5'-phosphate oxidase superfamily)
MIRPNEKAKQILTSIKYVAIATVDANNQPWNTPVAAFHFDDDYTLYWASWQDNQHSKNIRNNKQVFISVFDSTPPDEPTSGVYIQAEAQELTNEAHVMKAAEVFGDDRYNPSDGSQYLGDQPRRIYQAIPVHIWLNDDESINGDFVDRRIEAEE